MKASKGVPTKAAALELLESAGCGMRIVVYREKGMIRHQMSHMGHIEVDHRDTVQTASLGTVWLELLIWSQHIDCAVLIVIIP